MQTYLGYMHTRMLPHMCLVFIHIKCSVYMHVEELHMHSMQCM